MSIASPYPWLENIVALYLKLAIIFSTTMHLSKLLSIYFTRIAILLSFLIVFYSNAIFLSATKIHAFEVSVQLLEIASSSIKGEPLPSGILILFGRAGDSWVPNSLDWMLLISPAMVLVYDKMPIAAVIFSVFIPVVSIFMSEFNTQHKRPYLPNSCT
ncbi:hypothetical protein ACJX0J_036171 [Zea mays]